MRIFAAGLATETNTFASWPTGVRGFEEGGLFRGNASVGGKAPHCLVAQCFRQRAAAAGHEFVEGLFTHAQPSGPVVQSVYEGYRDEIIDQLHRDGPFDLVLLYLHGAMVSTDCDDCEGDLVRRVRQLVGSRTVIGVELDPHCHLSPDLVDAATLVVLMQEYPHVDFAERADELFTLSERAAAGRLRPVSAVFDCRMIGFYPTTREPMARLLEAVRAAERRPGVLSVSFVHGFPWGDTADTGSKVLVVTDNDPRLAAHVAEEVGRMIYAERHALLPRMPSIDAALERVVATAGCVVLADTADNPGGGAPGDNVTLLGAMLARGVRDAAFGCIWDPVAATVCAEAGVGTRLPLRLGGKSGLASGSPLDVEVTVRGVRRMHDQAGLGSSRVALGLSVWLESDGIDIVVISLRNQTFAPDAFTGLGVDLTSKAIVAVKSSQHYETHFAPLASLLLPVATPGAIQMDFAAMHYRKRDLNFFPRADDPLAPSSRGAAE